MDKITASRQGMSQMAMYVYQAHIERGASEENAKLYTAQAIQELYDEYTKQGDIKLPLKKSAGAALAELQRYVTAARTDNDSIFMKMLVRKVTEFADLIKKG